MGVEEEVVEEEVEEVCLKLYLKNLILQMHNLGGQQGDLCINGAGSGGGGGGGGGQGGIDKE